MATSGSKSVKVTNQHTLTFSWSRSSYSVANNTSTISWSLKLVGTNGTISSSAAKDWSVTVNGTTYSGTNTIGMSANTTKTLASGSTTIKHNADGTKTFTYSFSQEIAITYSGTYIGTKSGSGSGTLDTIPRASSITATNAYIEDQSTITITRASSSFTHTLQYKIGSQTSYTTIVSKTSSTSYKWTIPTAAYNYVSSTGKTVSITFKCITYSGSTKIGETTKTITATCSSSKCKPTLSPTVADTNETTIALTGNSDKLIKYYSDASYGIGASAKNGASIKSQSVVCGSTKKTTTPGTFADVSNNVFEFSATDSRGFTTTEKITLTMVNYIKLTCNLSASATLANTNTTTINFKISGKYFNGSFGATNNTLTTQYRYKAEDGSYSSWTTVTATISGNTYSYSGTITGLDYLKSYSVQARVIDKLATKNSSTKTVKSTPVFDWSADDFQFNVPVYAEGYSLTGLAKAMSTLYDLSTNGSSGGANWTLNGFTATLMGNVVRFSYDVTRSSATGTGNIGNETVLSAKIKHDGKIKSLYSNCVVSGGTGGLASYVIVSATNDGTYITFDMNIAATGSAITNSTGSFILPVVIDTTKY